MYSTVHTYITPRKDRESVREEGSSLVWLWYHILLLEVNASGTCITVTAYDYVTAQHMIAAMTM